MTKSSDFKYHAYKLNIVLITLNITIITSPLRYDFYIAILFLINS